MFFGEPATPISLSTLNLCVGNLNIITTREYESFENVDAATQIKKLSRKILKSIETTIDIDIALIDISLLQLLFPQGVVPSFNVGTGINLIPNGSSYSAIPSSTFIFESGQIAVVPAAGINTTGQTLIQLTSDTLSSAITLNEAQSVRQFAATIVGDKGNMYLHCSKVLIESYPNLATQSTSYSLKLKCLAQPRVMKVVTL